MKQINIIIFIVALITCFSCTHQETTSKNSQCEEIRSGIDVGSGTTKLLIAKVDTCRQKLLVTLTKKEWPVAFKENLKKSKLISKELKNEAIEIFKEIARLSKDDDSKRVKGVATQALREATNSGELFLAIEKESGIHIDIITQEQEKDLGRKSAQVALNIENQDLTVWDIGGGSMQISTPTQSYLSKNASVTFKEHAMKLLTKSGVTPNPLSKSEITKLVDESTKLASDIPEKLIRELTNTTLVGIGGVHNNLAFIERGSEEISLTDLEKSLTLVSDKEDSFFHSNYSQTEVTNLCLVVGHLKKMKISSYKIANVNLALALLF